MVKTLLRRKRQRPEPRPVDGLDGPNGQNGQIGPPAGAGANGSGGPGGPGVPGAAPADGGAAEIAAAHVEGAACPSCGAALQAGQEFCLDCGTPLWRRTSTWRVPAAIVGAVLAFAGTSTAVAFVAISDEGSKSVTVAENAPPETRTAPPNNAQAAVPPPAATPPAGDPGKPPPVDAPGGGAGSVPPATPVPPPSTGSSTSGGSGGASSSTGGDFGGSTSSTGGSSRSSGSGGSSSRSGSGSRSSGSSSSGSDRRPSSSGPTPVTLSGDPVTDFDPLGDGRERPGQVENVLDRDRATVWSTEEYPGGLDQGVGLVLNAATPTAARSLLVRTPDPGFAVAVYGARSGPPSGFPDGWTRLGSSASVSDGERISLSGRERYRHFLVWVTKLPSGQTQARIGELELFS